MGARMPVGTGPSSPGPCSSPTPLLLTGPERERKEGEGGRKGEGRGAFLRPGAPASLSAPFASQSTSRIPSEDWVAMTMSTMGWGVKSPASQALVHPPSSPALAPCSPRHLKGNQPKSLDPGFLPFPLPSLSSPPTRKRTGVHTALN